MRRRARGGLIARKETLVDMGAGSEYFCSLPLWGIVVVFDFWFWPWWSGLLE